MVETLIEALAGACLLVAVLLGIDNRRLRRKAGNAEERARDATAMYRLERDIRESRDMAREDATRELEQIAKSLEVGDRDQLSRP